VQQDQIAQAIRSELQEFEQEEHQLAAG